MKIWEIGIYSAVSSVKYDINGYTLQDDIYYSVDGNERVVWENIFDVFPSQNRVLTKNFQNKFPTLHCNEVLENYFSK